MATDNESAEIIADQIITDNYEDSESEEQESTEHLLDTALTVNGLDGNGIRAMLVAAAAEGIRIARIKQDEGVYDDPSTERAEARMEVARLEALFDAAGGRGVELADQLDAARAKLADLEF